MYVWMIAAALAGAPETDVAEETSHPDLLTSGPMRRLEYSAGDRWAIGLGATTFALPWLTSTGLGVANAVSGEPQYLTTAIPVAGPLIAMAQDGITGPYLYFSIANSVAQGIGLGLIVHGALGPKRREVRRLAVTPLWTPESTGVSFSGRF